MNLRSFFASLVLSVGAMAVVSCDYEPLDPAINLTPEIANPGNPAEPSEGDYWPAALNNTWNYVRGGETFQMKIVSINAINGHTYYTFNEQFGTGSSGMGGSAITRMRKSGGDYYEKVEDITLLPTGPLPGGTVSGWESIMLKDNVAVGSTWNHNIAQTTSYNDPMIPTLTTNLGISGKIIEKGVTVTVQGQVYDNVIKTEYSITMTMAGIPAGPAAVTTYWFAKDVGPIKAVTEDNSGENYTTELVSYSLY